MHPRENLSYFGRSETHARRLFRVEYNGQWRFRVVVLKSIFFNLVLPLGKRYRRRDPDRLGTLTTLF